MTPSPDSFPLIFAEGGLPLIPVQTPQATARVFLHGAHVTHFEPAGQRPVLFLSEASHFAAGKAIRGGVPIVFPWFGPHASDPAKPMHGFARTRPWQLESAVFNPDLSATLMLRLEADDLTRELFPHDFALRYSVHISHTLTLSLTVQNTSDRPFTFEEALHTYLNVSDVRQVEVTGLKKTTYIDKTDQMRRKPQKNPVIHIGGETDRVYLDTAAAVTVKDPAWRRSIRVEKTGSLATVIWNPHAARARAMPDLGDEQWREMLCVETANVAEHAVKLAPGASHTMTARIACSTEP